MNVRLKSETIKRKGCAEQILRLTTINKHKEPRKRKYEMVIL